MKPFLSALCLILPLLVSSSVLSNEANSLNVDSHLKFIDLDHDVIGTVKVADDKYFSFTQILDKVYQILTYDIDITIDPSSYSNFEGFLFTTQQFSSLFPVLKGTNPPQNVSIHLHIPVDLFKILNFTGEHIGVDLNATVDVMVSGQNFTSFNLEGYVHLEVLPVLMGVRIYIEDYNVNSIDIPASEVSKINSKAVMQFANSFGQLGVDYGNYILGQKVIRPSGLETYEDSSSSTDTSDDELFYRKEDKFVHQDGYVKIEATRREVTHARDFEL